MAIRSVRKKLEGDYGSFRFGAAGRNVLMWLVEFDSIGNTAADCYGAADPTTTTISIPVIGDGLSGMVCTGVDPRREGKSNIWVVTVTYETPQYSGRQGSEPKWNRTMSSRGAISQDEAQLALKPEDNPGHGTTHYTRVTAVNSAGDPFDPPLKQDIYDEEITITYYTTAEELDPDALADFRGTINAADVTFTVNGVRRDFVTKLVKIVDIQMQDVFDQRVGDNGGLETFRAIQVTVIIHIRSDGWTRQVPDMGYYEIVGGQKRHIRHNRSDVAQPAPLDGSGVALALTYPNATALTKLPFDLEFAVDQTPLFDDLSDAA